MNRAEIKQAIPWILILYHLSLSVQQLVSVSVMTLYRVQRPVMRGVYKFIGLYRNVNKQIALKINVSFYQWYSVTQYAVSRPVILSCGCKQHVTGSVRLWQACNNTSGNIKYLIKIVRVWCNFINTSIFALMRIISCPYDTLSFNLKTSQPVERYTGSPKLLPKLLRNMTTILRVSILCIFFLTFVSFCSIIITFLVYLPSKWCQFCSFQVQMSH